VDLRGAAAVGDCKGAVRGLEVLTRFELFCRNPLAQVRRVDRTNETSVINLRTR
jgi:hypothetical protein